MMLLSNLKANFKTHFPSIVKILSGLTKTLSKRSTICPFHTYCYLQVICMRILIHHSRHVVSKNPVLLICDVLE